MSSYPVNLTNCDQEPIHIPGKVQAHGFLVAVDSETYQITYISENTASFLGKEAVYFLGKSISEIEKFLDTDESDQLVNLLNLLKHGKNTDTISPYVISIHQQNFNLILATSGKNLL
ncbi:MAG: histidine kinase, partial [Sphingobacteriaceae bacterium]